MKTPRRCQAKKKVEKRGEQKKSAKKITKRRGRATFATFAFVRFIERLREIPFFLAFFFAKQQPLPSPPSPPAIGLRNHFGPHLQVRKKKGQQKKRRTPFELKGKKWRNWRKRWLWRKKILIFLKKKKPLPSFGTRPSVSGTRVLVLPSFFVTEFFLPSFFFLISIEPSTHAARMTLKKMTDRP